jgi:hypothetical protein
MIPPIDPEFYAIGAASGMSDEEIQADWEAYCADLETFHKDIEKNQVENPPQPDLTKDIKAFFTEPTNGNG